MKMIFRAAVAAMLAFGAVATRGAAQAQTAAPQAGFSYKDGRIGRYYDTGGDRIFYQVAGHGPAMLLIHGFPLSGDLFRGQIATLSQSFTVIAPDLPGFGKSTAGTPFQNEVHYAADLFALISSLGVRQTIIGGHSMGGQVALEMYHEQPSRVRGLILFDTNPAPASIVEQSQWPAYGVQAFNLGPASIAPSVVGVMVTGTSLITAPVLGTVISGIVSEATPAGILGGGYALAGRNDYRPLLGRIKVPTLVMVGRDDTVYPAPISFMLQAAIPGSRLAVIPAAGHASMFQSPVAANAAILSWAVERGLK